MEMVGRAKKFPLERLRQKACDAVSTAAYGRTFALGDIDRTEPAIEDIRKISGKNTKDCIRNVVRAVVGHGERTGTTDKIAKAFFGKVPLKNGDELPLFVNGDELASKINGMSPDLKAGFISSILEIFVETDEDTMNSVIAVYDLLRSSSGKAALDFLEQAASDRILDEGKSAVNKLSACVMGIYGKSTVKNIEENVCSFLSIFNSLSKTSQNAAFEFMRQVDDMLHEKTSEVLQFIELMAAPSVITSASAFSRINDVDVYDMPVEFIKAISNVARHTKDKDAVNDAALSALAIYGNLGSVTLFAYLETVGYVVETGGKESIIPLAQTAEEISNARDSEKIKSFFDDVLLCTTESTEMAETTIGIIQVCENAKKQAREQVQKKNDEDDYPELEIVELPGTAQKMREMLEIHLGGEIADDFASIIHSTDESDLPEAYNKYGAIIQRIDTAAEKLGRIDEEFEKTSYRKTYLELAAKLFQNMDNSLAYAPFAYWRLSDLVVTENKPEEFVENVILAKNNDELKKACYS